jgi:hypothetical protein
MDLVLSDMLLESGTQAVVLHVKAHPTFVSDAIVFDVWDVIRTMEASGARPAVLAKRLRHAWNEGRFKIANHLYWNSSRFLWDLPPTLHRLFTQADLAILKGDANYRRAVGDAIWDVEIPFSSVMQYFPAPLIALRSLKSDVIADLPVEVVRRLDQTVDKWRVGGLYGVIQFATAVRS